MTVWVVAACPENACAVDVTPRHCKAFKPKPGRKFKWTNTSLAGGKVVATGTVAADKWGLVTLKQLSIDKGKNRISIVKE